MTTLNKQVTQSDMDAREIGTGAVALTDVSIVMSSGAHWSGAYFSGGGSVPAGATINSATYSIYINTTSNDNVHGDFYIEANTSPSLFTTTTNDISSRGRTTAKTTLANNNVGAGWYAIDMTAVLQEHVNMPGYNGTIVVIWDANASTDCTYRAFDYSDGSLAPKFDVDYTVATASFIPPRRPRTYIRM